MGKKEERWRIKSIQGYRVGMSVADINYKARVERLQNDEEANNRRKIQMYIFQKLEQGYPADQLLKRMNVVFYQSRYLPYKKYFATWIESAMEKRSKQPRSKEDDGEER